MKKLVFIMPLMAISLLASCGGGGKLPSDPNKIPMHFTCLSNTASLSIIANKKVANNSSKASAPLLQYSTNAANWKEVVFEQIGETTGSYASFKLKKDESLYFRGDNPSGIGVYGLNFVGPLSIDYMHDGELAVSGNIMSLIQKKKFYDLTTLPEAAFQTTFSRNKNLTDASNLILPTTLSESCFSHMFFSCSFLTSVPTLSSKNLEKGCYEYMFKSCTSLEVAPELPATILKESCYNSMFNGCSKLNINEESGTKIFTCPSDIPDDAVTRMFAGCTGHKNDPEANHTYYYVNA